MITNDELLDTLFTAGIPYESVRIVDSRYSLPDSAWVTKTFYPSFRSALEALSDASGGALYAPETNDCDDFARLAHCLACALHRNTQRKAPEKFPGVSGIAFGWIAYSPDRGGGHAANILVTLREGVRLILFWEPQTNQWLPLSDNEIRSIFLCVI